MERTLEKLELAGRILLASVFLSAALGKIGNLESFITQIQNINPIDSSLNEILAKSLIGIELTLAISLLIEKIKTNSIVISIGLFLTFIVTYIIMIVKNLESECGCFGEDNVLNANTPLEGIIRNIFFITLSILLLLTNKKRNL